MRAPNVLYSPYGAFELKARYQANLMFGMLITVTVTGLILATAWLSAQLSDTVPIAPKPEPRTVDPWDIPVPPTIIPPSPELFTGGSPPSHVRAGIPVPRPDEEIDDVEMQIASKEEMAALVDSKRPGIIDGETGIVIDSKEDLIDQPDEPLDFVEIYPEIVYRHLPEYPPIARKLGITGVVVVQAVVDETGNVVDAGVFKSSGNDLLDEAAVAAAYNNKFSPGIQNGRPVKCRVRYTVVFELD